MRRLRCPSQAAEAKLWSSAQDFASVMLWQGSVIPSSVLRARNRTSRPLCCVEALRTDATATLTKTPRLERLVCRQGYVLGQGRPGAGAVSADDHHHLRLYRRRRGRGKYYGATPSPAPPRKVLVVLSATSCPPQAPDPPAPRPASPSSRMRTGFSLRPARVAAGFS